MSGQEAGTLAEEDKSALHPAIRSRERLLSLDVFRGFGVMGILYWRRIFIKL